MLTLNQSVGNNSDTIWCLRIKGEGRNLVTNGTFDSSSGWTLGTGWSIGSGVATFTGNNAHSFDNISRTVTAVTAREYILEIEVTAQTGTLNQISIEPGANSIVTTQSWISPVPLGKNIIRFKGNAGGTVLYIQVSGYGTGENISIDNITLREADNTIYLATRDLVLDNTFDGEVLHHDNYLTDLSFNSTIKDSGGISPVNTYSFSISRYVDNTNFNSFFNSLYPATDSGLIISKIVDFGVCWEGATADSDITWLFRGRVIDYSYDQRQMHFTVFQESEITNKQIPYYSVQKDFNNGVSYYPYAPKESFGLTIPIAYGDLTIGAQILGYIDTRLDYGNMSPCIRTSNNYSSFIATSHKCFYITADNVIWGDIVAVVYYYIPSLFCYMAVYNRDDSADGYDNDNTGYHFALQATRGVNNLKGFCRIKLTIEGKDSDVDTENVINDNVTDYVEIDNNEIVALKMAGTGSTSDTGFISNINSTDVQIVFDCSNDGSGTYNLEITYKNYTQTSSSGGVLSSSVSTETPIGYEIGTLTTAKKDALAWTIEELCGLDYLITNKSGTGGNNIRVYYAFIQLDNIFVQTKNYARDIRNNASGGRNV